MSFTVVGYGAELETPNAQVAIPARNVGTVQLESLTDSDLLTTASNGAGTGGGSTCFGDSGGPLLNGGFLVALTSYANSKFCNGRAGSFRLDTAEAHSFIAGF